MNRRRGGVLEDRTPAEVYAAKVAAAEAAYKTPTLSTPTSRGFRGAGAGSSPWLQAPDEWRGTSVQVCGLWPFISGTGTPMIGVPVGRNLVTGGTLCCDPISWFQRAALISNPSAFILGVPGLGKSALGKRWVTGLAGYGVLPCAFGDLKGEYADLIEALGGQVIRLGRGRGSLNVLDPGDGAAAAQRLPETARNALLADIHARRTTMLGALVTIMRGRPPEDFEETLLDRALRVLDAKHHGVPILADVLKVLQDAPEELQQAALSRGDMAEYHKVTRGLEGTLIALVDGGKFGDLFNRPTTVPMLRDRPVVFDVSSIDDTEQDLQAATLLACWSYGFGSINTSHALADAGMEPQRIYFVVLDELWRAIRAGKGMVDRVDALTRLNRSRGVGQVMISHTMADLMSVPGEADKMKARGFVERAGLVVAGGLPRSEMPLITSAVAMSELEQEMLTGWSAPPAWDTDLGGEPEPPGRGRFLAKVGGRPGIPFRVELTAAELAFTDTSARWRQNR